MATVERLDGNKAKLTIEVSKETFAEAMQQAYLKNKKRYNVPGFRKGKAPRKVIETMYGEAVFYEDAFEAVYPAAYDAVIEENNLEPVDRPQLDVTTISSDEGVVFTAEVQLKPEVTLGAYKGIELVKQEYTVEDAQVDAVIAQERERATRYVEVQRPVEQGDRVVIDYSGSVDGEKFEGGTAEDQTLDIGSGMFIPGFEEQLVGMEAGTEKDITVTFPEEYHAENLKGKEAVFHICLKTIQKKELPELDDELAKDISEFDTLDELKADRRKSLEERAKTTAQNTMENEAIMKVVDNATVDVPEVMISRQTEYALQEISYQLSMSGMTLEQYCKYTGTDIKALMENYHEESLNRVKSQLVLEAIAKAENIEATDEEVDQDLAEYASQAEKTVEEIRGTLTENDLLYFKDQIVVKKTVKLIMDNAKMIDAKPEAEEKPKKKAASTKKTTSKKKTDEPKAEPSEDAITTEETTKE